MNKQCEREDISLDRLLQRLLAHKKRLQTLYSRARELRDIGCIKRELKEAPLEEKKMPEESLLVKLHVVMRRIEILIEETSGTVASSIGYLRSNPTPPQRENEKPITDSYDFSEE